jgi:sec-independent protein translocase protein TatA
MVLLFISTAEMFFIGLILVMLFGAKKIPEIARGIGKGIREFKNATGDIQEEVRKTGREINESARVNKPKEESTAATKE